MLHCGIVENALRSTNEGGGAVFGHHCSMSMPVCRVNTGFGAWAKAQIEGVPLRESGQGERCRGNWPIERRALFSGRCLDLDVALPNARIQFLTGGGEQGQKDAHEKRDRLSRLPATLMMAVCPIDAARTHPVKQETKATGSSPPLYWAPPPSARPAPPPTQADRAPLRPRGVARRFFGGNSRWRTLPNYPRPRVQLIAAILPRHGQARCKTVR